MTFAAFEPEARAAFAAAYPEVPHRLTHELRGHPLMTLNVLAELAEALPAASCEYYRADLPVGLNGIQPPGNGLGIGETIRRIDETRSWAAIKNIEQVPAYRELLQALLEEMRPAIEARTGAMLRPQGSVFITSPGGVTPYHFDPEHNLLLHLAGTKIVTLFPQGDPWYAPDEAHEACHTGAGCELFWREEMAHGGTEWKLVPGEALYVPMMAPHHVRNGPASAISLSITWRSEWSCAEADARAFNAVLRRMGLTPRAPGRWPADNRVKAAGGRVLRRLAGFG